MVPLSTPVRFACLQAQDGVFWLQAREFPASLQRLREEGRNDGEARGTMAAAHARIAETLAVAEAEAAGAEDMAVDPASSIAHALPIGRVLDVTAERDARDWALPQFYRERARAKDRTWQGRYAAHMLAYLRSPWP